MMTAQALDECLSSAIAGWKGVLDGRANDTHPMMVLQAIAALQQAAALTQLVDVLTDAQQELVTLRQLVEEIAPQDSDGSRHIVVRGHDGY